MRKRHRKKEEADLDITSFMNLMIILVPVLLMTMVLSQITVLDINLPLLGGESATTEQKEKLLLEVVIEPEQMVINMGYPKQKNFARAATISKMANDEGELDYDYVKLQNTLKNIKAGLRQKNINKKDILILSQPDTDYQTIVRTMDTVRSFKAVDVGATLVDAALFPAVSLGDAPPLAIEGANP